MMKAISFSSALILTASMLSASANPAEDAQSTPAGHSAESRDDGQKAPKVEGVELFNGKNLDGWSHLLVDKSLSKDDVWSVKDGILVCKGMPLGYLHTNASYKNFVLNLEWRWAPGTEPTNSGVLLRIAAEPATFLPKCVEAQLQHQNAGDLYGFFGANITGDEKRFKVIESEKIGTFKSVKKITGAEKPAGEWNHYRIKVVGDTVTLHINGELVNEASGIDVIAGPIGLQSEGSEIHFRNIRLEALK